MTDLCLFPEVSFPLVSNTFLIWNGNFPLQIQRLSSLCKTNKTKENITSFFESNGYFLFFIIKHILFWCLEKYLEKNFIQTMNSIIKCSLVNLRHSLFQSQFRACLYEHIYRIRTSVAIGHSGLCKSQLQHALFIWTAGWFESL